MIHREFAKHSRIAVTRSMEVAGAEVLRDCDVEEESPSKIAYRVYQAMERCRRSTESSEGLDGR